jgi:hypothetical protein
MTASYILKEKHTRPKSKSLPSFITCLEKVVEGDDEDKLERERVLNIFYSKLTNKKLV